jgi:cis-3-alkyl-4-acyloxetan-2-one decarboxylase
MTIRASLSTFAHRYLRVPYALNIQVFRAPKKPRATYIMIHGIGNSLNAWDEVVSKMPKDVQVIGVDLLGFGKSPKPQWATYNAITQARSLAVTLLNLRLKQRPILVGHSLGALVAVEVAKRYPLFIKELVLCSPPFYKPEVVERKGLRAQEDMLRDLYRFAKKFPDRLEKMSPIAVKLGLANRALSITQDNVGAYLAALESSIINQTSLRDIEVLKLPIVIFYGALDPVVVGKHIVRLGKEQPNVTAKRIIAGHEVVGLYASAVAKRLSVIATDKTA